ncbi:hypothetical protein [Bacillus suaedaesalsae]|uniref:Lipoprotein n=1 Tax=Bacillus suaedaesalsae TaxID=2810349 RepID=A0ABS2DMV2_9BACI|nr:hypothetical protein [Bacillus suaedaesalsae]MBM6618821.1 hypothetical protein [Bacillus suaedaesalsae]
MSFLLYGCQIVEPEYTINDSAIAELTVSYKNFKQLKKDATIIAEVEVIGQKTIIHSDMPFTISKVKILSTKKGNVSHEETINIIETGGEYKPLGKENEELPEVKMSLNGVRPMIVGEHLFLFLEPFVGPQIEGAYIPLGAYQGKFQLKDNKVKQLSSEEYFLPEFAGDKEVPLEDFNKMLMD